MKILKLLIFANMLYGNGFESNNSYTRDIKNIFSTKHIREYINYPNIVKDYSISGISVVEFIVHSSGDIDNIEIIKSIGEPFDKEIMIGLEKIKSEILVGYKISEQFKYRLPIYFKN